MGLFDVVRGLQPLSKGQKKQMKEVEKYLEEEEIKAVTRLVKQKRLDVRFTTFGVSKKINCDIDYPLLKLMKKDDPEKKFADEMNSVILNLARRKVFRKFAPFAEERISKLIAPAIVGFDTIKKTAAYQLFSVDPVHVLLLGDPGTGKTQILSATTDLAPISSFGLGSGTSGVGLAATVKGKTITKGLLPMADQGLCAIDELNLMKPSDMAAMYNAMEKGFVTYTKGSSNLRFQARIRVLATANPKGDRFVGHIVDVLKQQLPFDPALLSRFHIVFLVRRPDTKRFREISKHIVHHTKSEHSLADIRFVKDYIDYTERIEVEFPKSFEKQVGDFAEDIKENERKYLVEVSPRLIIGLIRLAKARARMHLKKVVSEEDLKVAEKIILKSLEV